MSKLKFICPSCKKSLKVPRGMLGQTIECPACGKQIKIPRHKHPETISLPKEKSCPHCGKQILVVAMKCKHCRSNIGVATALEKSSKAMMSCGCALTLLVTIPLLLLLFLIGGC